MILTLIVTLFTNSSLLTSLEKMIRLCILGLVWTFLNSAFWKISHQFQILTPPITVLKNKKLKMSGLVKKKFKFLPRTNPQLALLIPPTAREEAEIHSVSEWQFGPCLLARECYIFPSAHGNSLILWMPWSLSLLIALLSFPFLSFKKHHTT